MTRPIPVTGSVVVKDLAERAALTALEAAIPFLIVMMKATDWSGVKVAGLAALSAAGGALLSLLKGLIAQRLTGTASLSRSVSDASAVVPAAPPH